MRELVKKATVPGTDVTITIEVQPADPKLAAILKDKPGKGAWIDFYYVTRQPGTATFVNYLHTGRPTLDEARREANFLWSDTVTRRDAKPF